MDQRRADAVMDLFRRVADGNELPWMSPAATARSGSCCTRTPSSATAPPRTPPASCAVSARPPRSTRTPRPCWPAAEIAAGAATRVLLVDGDGVLQRTMRLPKAPPGGWTRDLLVGQVRAALPDLPSTCRPSPTNPPWRSPTTSERSTRGAPPMTAPGSRPAATWTTTSPGPADPPASRTCVHAAGATTSSRPEASCEHACTPTAPSPPQPCSARRSPPDPNPCPASGPARPTPPRTRPDEAGTARQRHLIDSSGGCASDNALLIRSYGSR